MSLSAEGRIIYCDGADCCASVPAPVALRPTRTTGGLPPPPDASGWLFVVRQGLSRHYCPRCVPQYLSQMAMPERGMPFGLNGT
ncbi:MAG: hypothetical protein SFU56_09640 [Capsulimonadales bacterium]|nr:hypothetical protein [Capsulimonadales bacterium]